MVHGYQVSWAAAHIAKLKAGEPATMHPLGRSMEPLIRSGQEVTVRPLQADEPAVGDIVLVHVAGKDYLHLVKTVSEQGYQIGNNKGRINGWVNREAIYGKLV